MGLNLVWSNLGCVVLLSTFNTLTKNINTDMISHIKLRASSLSHMGTKSFPPRQRTFTRTRTTYGTQHFTLHLIAPWRLCFQSGREIFHRFGNNKENSFEQVGKNSLPIGWINSLKENAPSHPQIFYGIYLGFM